MSVKTMIFVDGSWLYHSRQVLFESLGEESGFEIDYKRIPDIIAHEVGTVLGEEVDVVRTNYFGTIPVNKQGYNPSKQKSFYDFLALQCAYDTEILEIDFRREPHARPDDKWVNVALASSMLYYAGIPGSFDVATIIGGDADYIPLLRRIRLMGKRVQIVGMNSIDGKFLTSPMLLTTPGIQDFPPIFLDEHAQQIRLVREAQNRVCKTCGRTELTTWAGPEFFCSVCRQQHRKQVRVCDTCGREEETTWDKPYFYCSECRSKHRAAVGAPEAAVAGKMSFRDESAAVKPAAAPVPAEAPVAAKEEAEVPAAKAELPADEPAPAPVVKATRGRPKKA